MSDSLLRYPAFRNLMVARAVSGAGSWMQTVAAGWLMYQLTGSAAAVGVMAVLAKGPSLVGAPFGGWLADRVDQRRLAVLLNALQIVPPALLALLAWDRIISPVEIYVLVFLVALPAGLNNPVLAELAPRLVPENLRHSAYATSAVAFNTSRLIGPALGGGLVTTLGAAAAFGANALSYVAVVVALLLVPSAKATTERRPAAAGAGPAPGYREALRSGLMQVMLATAAAFFAFVGPVEQLMPAVAAAHGDEATYIGLLLASLALGGLIGNPLIRGLQKRGVSELAVLRVGLLVAGLMLIALGWAPDLWLDIVILVIIGGVWELIWVTESTTIHFRAPAGASGRLMGLLYMVASISIALGSLVAGWAFELIGVSWSLVISGTVLGVSALFARRRLRRREHVQV